MSRLVHTPSRERIGHFMGENLGQGINPSKISQVYPVVHKRLVFRYNGDRVLKIRPEKSEKERCAALLEAKKLDTLLTFYKEVGYSASSTVKEYNGFMVIDMPHMGNDISRMVYDLDMREHGEEMPVDSFRGFTRERAEQLVQRLRDDLLILRERSGYVHGDLFNSDGPNNVVYNSELGRFLVIDAEALSEAGRRTIDNYEAQFNQLAAWIVENLVVN